MITKIVPIGNSKGIRIPNHVLKQMNIDSQVELIINDKTDEIILKPVHKVREGWNEAFKNMNTKNHDELIIDDSLDLDTWDW